MIGIACSVCRGRRYYKLILTNSTPQLLRVWRHSTLHSVTLPTAGPGRL